MALPRKSVRLLSLLVVLSVLVYAAYYFSHDFAEQCSPVLARKLKFENIVAKFVCQTCYRIIICLPVHSMGANYNKSLLGGSV